MAKVQMILVLKLVQELKKIKKLVKKVLITRSISNVILYQFSKPKTEYRREVTRLY